MGTAVHVPQTRDMIGEELSGDEALTALRHYGGRKLLVDAFTRFRYADGFSHARSLGYQIVLGMVPFVIALVGVATTVHTDSVGRVVELTLESIVPGDSSDLVEDALGGSRRTAASDFWSAAALWLGLGFAVLNLASAMAQVERGGNRIYGIERDRPFLAKYGRSLLLSMAAGLPLVLGFVFLVAGGAVGHALAETYPDFRPWLPWWRALDTPAGVLLAWIASAAIFRWSPRRVQPGYTWLAFGSAVHLVLWVGATWLLAVYVARSGSFGDVYGPLTAFIALLLWANLTGVVLFLGLAFAAQLEAARAGFKEPVHPDPEQHRDPEHPHSGHPDLGHPNPGLPDSGHPGREHSGQTEGTEPGGGTGVGRPREEGDDGVQDHFGGDQRGAENEPGPCVGAGSGAGAGAAGEKKIEGVSDDGGEGHGRPGRQDGADEDQGGAPGVTAGHGEQQPVRAGIVVGGREAGGSGSGNRSTATA